MAWITGGMIVAKSHFMQWAPQDWLSSPLRGELALERDHLTRAVYRDLVDVLHERGGYLPRTEVAGACLVSREEAERAIARLLESGRIQETAEGMLYNERVLSGLERERTYLDEQSRSGGEGGRTRAARMTPEERSEAARKAALAKHGRSDPADDAKAPYAGSVGLRSSPSPSPSPLPLPEEEEGAASAAPPPADPAPAKRTRKKQRDPMPEGFPAAALRAEFATEFPDLAIDDAIREFTVYCDREEATYIGLRGWTQALRGALLRDRSKGLFRKVPLRAVRPSAPSRGSRPFYPDWSKDVEEHEAKQAAEKAAAQGRLLA